MLFNSISEMIGNTPILKCERFGVSLGIKADIYAKLEYMNPAGSAKDRVAREILDAAEKRGDIGPETVIIEPTSGNTGIGLAAIAAQRGYRVVLVMPETMSVERRNILKALGAEIVLTQGELGMSGSIAKAEELHKLYPDSFIAGQFTNSDNPLAHYKTTGPEIYADMGGTPDIFIATVGTGGTITGTARFLKEKNSECRVIAVEPEGSPVLSGGQPGPHKLQGIGAGFVPKVLDTGIYDEVMAISDDDAFAYAKKLAHTEGILVGISSGAALAAAVKAAQRPENAGRKIAVLLSDGGDRYFSTPLFTEE